MIQPTMYFNLRHVPMFYGPYIITDVTHSIQPGRFETIFNGVRQSIASLPKINNYLTSLNKNVVSDLRKKISSDTSNKIDYNQNLKSEAELIQKVNTGTPSVDQLNACGDRLTGTSYNKYVITTPTKTTETFKNIIDVINGQTNIDQIKLMVFISMYMASSSDTTEIMESYNNNYAMVPLDGVNWKDGNKFFSPENSYICLTKTNLQSRPYACFASLQSHIQFLIGVWDIIAITGQLSEINVNTITKTFVNFYPKIDNIYDSMVENGTITTISQKVSKGYNKARQLGLIN